MYQLQYFDYRVTNHNSR